MLQQTMGQKRGQAGTADISGDYQQQTGDMSLSGDPTSQINVSGGGGGAAGGPIAAPM